MPDDKPSKSLTPVSEAAPLTLVEIERQYRGIAQQIQDNFGELTETTEAELDRVIGLLLDKIDGYYMVSKHLEALEAVWKTEKESCAAAQRAVANHLERMKWRLKQRLLERPEGDRRLSGTLIQYYLKKAAPKLVWENPNDKAAPLPEEYKRVETKVSVVPDEEKIWSDLESGKEIPGVRLEEVVALCPKKLTRA